MTADSNIKSLFDFTFIDAPPKVVVKAGKLLQKQI